MSRPLFQTLICDMTELAALAMFVVMIALVGRSALGA